MTAATDFPTLAAASVTAKGLGEQNILIPCGDSDTHFVCLGLEFACVVQVVTPTALAVGDDLASVAYTPIYQGGCGTGVPGTDKIIIPDASGASGNNLNYRVLTRAGLVLTDSGDQGVFAKHGYDLVALTNVLVLGFDNFGDYYETWSFDAGTDTLTEIDWNPTGFAMSSNYSNYRRIDDTRVLVWTNQNARICSITPDGLTFTAGAPVVSANGYNSVWPDFANDRIWIMDDSAVFTPYDIAGVTLTAGPSITLDVGRSGNDESAFVTNDGTLLVAVSGASGSTGIQTADGTVIVARSGGIGYSHTAIGYPGLYMWPVNDTEMIEVNNDTVTLFGYAPEAIPIEPCDGPCRTAYPDRRTVTTA